MPQLDLATVRARFPDARQESDNSIVFECPICRAEGHANKQAKLFANGAIACSRFASAGTEANRAHCQPLREMLNLSEQPTTFIKETLFDGTLTLELAPASRGKVLLVARNCSSVLSRDVLSLDKAADRAQFIKRLALDEAKQQTLQQTLLALADRFQSAQAAIDEEEETQTKHVIFAALDDGRLVEQIAGGLFAVYDPERGEVTYQRRVETEEATYRPLQDDFLLKGGLFLPERLVEYGNEAALDAQIEACISRYSDVPARELKLSAKYVRLSYIADKLNEISYFRATGERGSGKSRFISTIGLLCLRPVLVSSPSAASLFRMMDAYAPTLIIDECNFAQGSEDTEVLMQILNSGFQRLTYVSRMDRSSDGQMTLRMFSAFGPKLIGSLKLSDSPAFESRCVAVQLQKTERKDIPFRMTEQMLRDFADLRAKLYLWRLRNWRRDYEQAFDQAESELKTYEIEPRFIQIATPVYGLMDDAQLKADFAQMLESRTDDAASEKQESFDGLLVATVHRLLFDVEEGEKEETRTATWKPRGNTPAPEEGRPLELASIEQITATINEGQPEKKKYTDKWISKELGKLGFKRKEITRRQSLHYRKSAIVFARDDFAKAFRNYFLPLPGDFIPCIPCSEPKPNNHSEMRCTGQVQEDPPPESHPVQRISLTDGDLRDLHGMHGMDFQEGDENISTEPYPARRSTIPPIVALDTETESFDEKAGITPRTAKMIGLALSYDGEGQTSYTTDRQAWPLLMPEPEQIVVMHNAKFDLLKLDQAGLPLPKRWEDTLIASHLLDETGAHGLKPLAKEHLDVDDPTTFEEANRMRLLDPAIFDEYARNDARYTFRLWPKFQREMERQGLLPVYELEKAVLPVVMAMEDAGLKIDLARMAEMSAAVTEESERIETELFEHAGCRFDLHSPQKVAAIIFDKLGVPSHKETGGGQRSVDREALEEVRGHHPAVDAILRYREIDKLASTFLTVLPKFADEQGRIHPEFRQLGATSGRFSCSNPNVQQIPSRSDLGKKLRQMFTADEGNVLVVADWSQMELRILAHYSKDPLLLEAYAFGHETDLHTLTASKMFNKAVEQVEKTERAVAKMINFGIAYGITAIGLFNRLKPSGVDVSQEDCERFITDYFKTYADVRKFLTQVETRVRERGYVKNWFGRRRRVSGQTAREVRQAQNFVIQATAADMAKTAMVKLHAALPEGARLIAMVHDEFIVECRAEQAEDVRALMVEVMQAAPEAFIVPMVVEAKTGQTWGEAK